MPTATKKPKAKAKRPPAPEPTPVAPRISVIVTGGNYVGALQEAAVREGIAFPVYEPDSEEGPDHSKRFGVRVTFDGRSAYGRAATKKIAKTKAAMFWAGEFGAVAEK